MTRTPRSASGSSSISRSPASTRSRWPGRTRATVLPELPRELIARGGAPRGARVVERPRRVAGAHRRRRAPRRGRRTGRWLSKGAAAEALIARVDRSLDAPDGSAPDRHRRVPTHRTLRGAQAGRRGRARRLARVRRVRRRGPRGDRGRRRAAAAHLVRPGRARRPPGPPARRRVTRHARRVHHALARPAEPDRAAPRASDRRGRHAGAGGRPRGTRRHPDRRRQAGARADRRALRDDRACGGDRRRRSDGADVGGRAGVGGRRRRHRRAARQPGPRRLARRRSALTHHRGARSARHRRSVPRRRGRWLRSRASPGSRWTSATFPPGTPTGSGCGRTTSSASWPAGSASWRCRSIADVR